MLAAPTTLFGQLTPLYAFECDITNLLTEQVCGRVEIHGITENSATFSLHSSHQLKLRCHGNHVLVGAIAACHQTALRGKIYLLVLFDLSKRFYVSESEREREHQDRLCYLASVAPHVAAIKRPSQGETSPAGLQAPSEFTGVPVWALFCSTFFQMI